MSEISNNKFNNAFIYLLIFLFCLVVYKSSPIKTSFDSRWTVYIAESIFHEFNTDLNEYKKALNENDYYHIETVKGKIYSIFPIGSTVIALPFIYIADLYFEFIGENAKEILFENHSTVELWIASIITAIIAVFIFIISRNYLNIKQSLLLSFIFAFCTSAWSTFSRALWQHGPSSLMLSIVLLLLIISKKKTTYIQYIGFPLAFSYVIRPTNSISVILFSLFIFIYHRKYFLRFLLWASIIAIPFICFNIVEYGNILSPYYQPQRIGLHPEFFEALIGNLFSPSRGLFFCTPILMFSILGIYYKCRRNQMENFDFFIIAIMIFHWITVSSFPGWEGGHSFGSRFFSDMIIFFIYFLIPFIQKLPEYPRNQRIVLSILFLLFLSTSLFIHYRGSHSFRVWEWNIDMQNNRNLLWDLTDIQFLRGL